MPRRADLLNVKHYLLNLTDTLDCMLESASKARPGGIVLPPAYEQALREFKLVGAAILRKHAAKQTRKDIYIGKFK